MQAWERTGELHGLGAMAKLMAAFQGAVDQRALRHGQAPIEARLEGGRADRPKVGLPPAMAPPLLSAHSLVAFLQLCSDEAAVGKLQAAFGQLMEQEPEAQRAVDEYIDTTRWRRADADDDVAPDYMARQAQPWETEPPHVTSEGEEEEDVPNKQEPQPERGLAELQPWEHDQNMGGVMSPARGRRLVPKGRQRPWGSVIWRSHRSKENWRKLIHTYRARDRDEWQYTAASVAKFMASGKATDLVRLQHPGRMGLESCRQPDPSGSGGRQAQTPRIPAPERAVARQAGPDTNDRRPRKQGRYH